MSPQKQVYMQVLYNCKNKDTVDNMDWDELMAFYSMMIMESEGIKNG